MLDGAMFKHANPATLLAENIWQIKCGQDNMNYVWQNFTSSSISSSERSEHKTN